MNIMIWMVKVQRMAMWFLGHVFVIQCVDKNTTFNNVIIIFEGMLVDNRRLFLSNITKFVRQCNWVVMRVTGNRHIGHCKVLNICGMFLVYIIGINVVSWRDLIFELKFKKKYMLEIARGDKCGPSYHKNNIFCCLKALSPFNLKKTSLFKNIIFLVIFL